MSFILTITLCSFINTQCLPPKEVKQRYNSWKECTIAALELSKVIIISQQGDFVNNNKLATQFTCTEVDET